MSRPTNKPEEIFFHRADLDAAALSQMVDDGLRGMDDGELYLQYGVSEDIVFDDGRVKSSSYDTLQGFGFRAVVGEATGYAHSNVLTNEAIKQAIGHASAVKSGHDGALDASPVKGPQPLYTDHNPLQDQSFSDKVALLQKVDQYARRKSNQVAQVSASLSGEWEVITIIRPDGFMAHDVRPLVNLRVSVIASDGSIQESGSYAGGGRTDFKEFFKDSVWQSYVDEALRMATLKLEAKPAPAGEMPVVLGSGWCGVLLHEAVGHGLEGDFNRKQTSAFAGLMGEQVAAKGVTVVDDGTMPDRRGSLTIDDEGTPTQRNVLIEDGRLVGYLQDRLNGRLMGTGSSGNGRRESYGCLPMPRMTNTFMLAGDAAPEEMIADVDRGLYAVNFGGGQVDITSGKYVFSATEAYMIENGKITHPVKNATLIGDGPTALTKIRRVGNDMDLDPGIGTCGKDGQSVPVGVGQPSMLIDGITVGGTAG